MVAAVVVIVGGVLRHQWLITGELIAMAGLFAVGWICSGIWHAAHIGT